MELNMILTLAGSLAVFGALVAVVLVKNRTAYLGPVKEELQKEKMWLRRGEYNAAMVKGRQNLELLLKLVAEKNGIQLDNSAQAVANAREEAERQSQNGQGKRGGRKKEKKVMTHQQFNRWLAENGYLDRVAKWEMNQVRLIGNKAVHENYAEKEDAWNQYNYLEDILKTVTEKSQNPKKHHERKGAAEKDDGKSPKDQKKQNGQKSGEGQKKQKGQNANEAQKQQNGRKIEKDQKKTASQKPQRKPAQTNAMQQKSEQPKTTQPPVSSEDTAAAERMMQEQKKKRRRRRHGKKPQQNPAELQIVEETTQILAAEAELPNNKSDEPEKKKRRRRKKPHKPQDASANPESPKNQKVQKAQESPKNQKVQKAQETQKKQKSQAAQAVQTSEFGETAKKPHKRRRRRRKPQGEGSGQSAANTVVTENKNEII